MKLLLLSIISSLLLYSLSSLNPLKQNESIPSVKVVYHPVSTAKLDRNSDTIVETWKTNNTVTLQSDPKRRVLSFKEVNEKKQVVKSYSYPIVSFQTDEETYQFTLNTDAGTANYVVWKDKRMVVIEASDWNYLISK